MTRCREWGKVGSWKNDHDVQPGRSMGIVQKSLTMSWVSRGAKRFRGSLESLVSIPGLPENCA